MHEVCGFIPLRLGAFCYFHLGSFPLRDNSHIAHAQLVKMFHLRGGESKGGAVARALTPDQYEPGSNPFINTINNMVDEEPLCGPYATSKSWVWVREILLYLFICLFIYLFIYFNILATDHVNRRCGKNNGRDTGRHWISKSMYNYLDAREQSCSAGSRRWRWTSAGLVQKSFSLSSHFFYLFSKIESHLHFSTDSYDSLH